MVCLGGTILSWPVAGAAQQSRSAKVGVLVLGNPNPEAFLTEFRGSLRRLGYIEGQNFAVELRSAKGNPADLGRLAAELVGLKVDVIVAFQTPTATAAKQATSDVPIVMCPVGDPVATGLVASLAKPGGNVTGVSAATAELGAKNLEFVREVLPSARKVAVLANATDPFHKPFLELIQRAARPLNFDILPVMVQAAQDLGANFAELAKTQPDAVIVQPSLPLRHSADLALKHRLPTFSPSGGFAAAGGLLTYVADVAELYREGAVFVDKILKGRKPQDLPVQQPTKFRLIVNLKTARALGLTITPALLIRADQVIE
jgi:putative ABC transport system substrate-binding protein